MHRQKMYKMDRQTADETLKNIFAAADYKPNETSFDILVIKTIANTTLVKVCKWISIIALILVTISPLAFHRHTEFKIDNISSSSQVSVLSHRLYQDHFEMILSGNIDYPGIYCKKADGSIVMPAISDASNHIVDIPFDGESLNIYITCRDGSVVQALLSK